MGQLCDDGCIAVLDKKAINVYKDKKKVLTGHRNLSDGLWDVPLTNSPSHPPSSSTSHPPVLSSHKKSVNVFDQKVNAVIRRDKTRSQLGTYLHATCGSPPPSTFFRAIKKGNLLSWPGITNIKPIDVPYTIETAKGHLDAERKNLRTTNTMSPSPSPVRPATAVQEDETPQPKTLECFAVIQPFTQRAYSDLTGRYPHTSSRGHKYILVVYDHDSNAILVTPLKNRQAAEITKGWTEIHDRLARHDNAPKLFILDNEVSFEFKKALDKKNIAFQLVPPHTHRRNAAERAIRTFKNHFLSVLATADPEFPVSEWDRLLPQAELTLNLLRNSRVNPRLSSYAYLFGPFDFNTTPLAPAGTKVLVHEKPSQRASWAYHGVEGWYIGPSLHHYRCLKCYLPSTGGTRDADTVQFFPKQIPFPQISTEDYLLQAATDILTVLKNPPPSLPSLTFGDATRNAIDHLARLLQRAVKRPKPFNLRDPKPLPSQHPSPRVGQSPGLPSPPVPPPPATAVPRVQRQHIHRSPIAAAAAHAHEPSFPPQMSFASPDPPSYRHKALQTIVAQEFFTLPSVNHIYNDITGKRETIDSLLAGSNGAVWTQAVSNELGRLAQGLGSHIDGSNTIDFIHRHEVPATAKVTYANMVCDYRPLKAEPNRVRLTVGGDRLSYPSDAGSPAASLLEAKLLLNSTISDADSGARFLSADIKDFFLATPMDDPEYMRIHSKYFFQDIRAQYDIENKVASDGYIYVRINKGMYGLKQAAVLAYNGLVKNLKPHGYFPCPSTSGIWRHVSRKTAFCLCVDDFGVKYFNKSDADHLLHVLQQHYKISIDWEGKDYLGLHLDWNYPHGYVDVSMPKYIPKLLSRLNHPAPKRPQFAPHRWTQPAFGQRIQFAPPPDSTSKLDATDTKLVQSVTGSLLYYGRALDPTILPALNEIANSQAAPTAATMDKVKMLLDYMSTYPNAVLRFYKSGMILHIDSDAAYLVLPNARSRYAGHFFLSTPTSDNRPPLPNAPIHTECKTIRSVVASAAEAETAGIFGNGQTAVIIRRALAALGHPQPPTPLKTDNSTAHDFVHSNI